MGKHKREFNHWQVVEISATSWRDDSLGNAFEVTQARRAIGTSSRAWQVLFSVLYGNSLLNLSNNIKPEVSFFLYKSLKSVHCQATVVVFVPMSPGKWLIPKDVDSFRFYWEGLISTILCTRRKEDDTFWGKPALSGATSLIILPEQTTWLYILINAIIGIWNLFKNADLFCNRGLWLNLELFMVCRCLWNSNIKTVS